MTMKRIILVGILVLTLFAITPADHKKNICDPGWSDKPPALSQTIYFG